MQLSPTRPRGGRTPQPQASLPAIDRSSASHGASAEQEDDDDEGRISTVYCLFKDVGPYSVSTYDQTGKESFATRTVTVPGSDPVGAANLPNIESDLKSAIDNTAISLQGQTFLGIGTAAASQIEDAVYAGMATLQTKYPRCEVHTVEHAEALDGIEKYLYWKDRENPEHGVILCASELSMSEVLLGSSTAMPTQPSKITHLGYIPTPHADRGATRRSRAILDEAGRNIRSAHTAAIGWPKTDTVQSIVDQYDGISAISVPHSAHWALSNVHTISGYHMNGRRTDPPQFADASMIAPFSGGRPSNGNVGESSLETGLGRLALDDTTAEQPTAGQASTDMPSGDTDEQWQSW
ncbi:hypothetical protein I317_05963 [Kwoniella heveanensis CBS 569]|nr:hypothetical protein I317_05963 [Kwoniella heveanensis CBS 569]